MSPPSIVPGASIRPSVSIPAAERPGLDGGRLGPPVRLARAERDGAAVRDQQRVEGVHEVRARQVLVEVWTVGPE